MKVGNRVTVLANVSNRMDAGSTAYDPAGVSRKHLVGKRGEVVEILPDGRILVDDQIRDGVPVGSLSMREYFTEAELEIG